MNNYNFGGIKYGGYGLSVRYNTTETNRQGQRYAVQNEAFQGYATPEAGAAHFVTFLTDAARVSAIQQYLAHPGNALPYAQALKRASYFTSEAETYGLDLQRRVNGIRRSGVLDRIPGINPPPDPAANRTTQRREQSVPNTDNTAAVVRPMTSNVGVPPERLGQYVELGVHNPTKGLRVRVMEEDRVKVVPTNKIYSMTFESRGVPRANRVSARRLNPNDPAGIVRFIQTCKEPPDPFDFVNSLVDSFVRRVGTPAMSLTRGTEELVAALITAAVTGITGLRNRDGLLGPTSGTPGHSVLNIEGGIPNSYNPDRANLTLTGTSGISSKARSVLKMKARALVQEITFANNADLTRAISLLNGLSRGNDSNATLPQEILGLLAPWQEDIEALFHGTTIPPRGPFQTHQTTRLVEDNSERFSPVFPVSDALGYEHYGSYQYGRGLSIEPGGNYEQLMATDPLQFASDILRERFLRAIRSTDPNPQARAERIRGALRDIANDPEFLNGPGAAVALAYLEQSERNGDRTTMISNGLANYVMSDRDSVMKLPVNNVAYRLADLQPMGQDDQCSCRGAEADLLLAAYMAGDAFTIIDSEDAATNWVAEQMVYAAKSWSEAQQKMRGMAPEVGRRSLLDNVEGWERLGQSYQQTVKRAERSLGSVQTNSERVSAQLDNIVSGNPPRPVPPRTGL
jgi:hypothetical protein